MQHKKKILIFIDWFLPGYKAGGPVRSMANMVEYLKDTYQFFIVTRNTDYTETTPYTGIKPNVWTDFSENVKVFYTTPEYQNLASFKRISKAEVFDVIYINGIYSWKFSILPLMALRNYKGRKVVASRGMLAQSAIDVKGGKKKIFLKLAKFLNMYKDVVFHVTNDKEKEDVNEALGLGLSIRVADNLPKKELPLEKSIHKVGGKLRLVSLARISPEKNTLFAIEQLAKLEHVKGEIVFDLYGQVYDADYWEACQKVMDRLPENIRVSYKGLVDADLVGEKIQHYHVLFLPSRGENFGHVILESLMSGRPVLISDQTPWRDLAKEQCDGTWHWTVVTRQGYKVGKRYWNY
ncbi:glycosyltransferase family 4 protein [Saccharicrinis fermentans]|uniref:Glycosyltransferase n=1 Tax=Saccharicrinis fermentans DSM 9555 = JCM 21142 TaxID=869213 RepID=W7Y9A9_9BACT|nr:glycosyltransferase family 4 protein [Saccharicrinis fermentans]GAF04922.1 glycosyltransferase [Saccharicrinis fermentans DSM 9555 = JCM 21142]